MKKWLKLMFMVPLSLFLLALGGCSKDPVKIVSASVVSGLDKGSGNFDRVVQICFDQPLSSDYFHKITLVTHQNVKIDGAGWLRPLASDPNNKCHLRNVYLYIHKDSPLDARQLIKDYVLPGNISQILVQMYYEEPQGKELPMAEKIFSNL
jgi:hypothetical protein